MQPDASLIADKLSQVKLANGKSSPVSNGVESEKTKGEESIDMWLKRLYASASNAECIDSGRKLAKLLLALGPYEGLVTIERTSLLENLARAAKNSKSGYEREGAMVGFYALAEEMKHPIDVLLIDQLPLVLDLYADKGDVVREAAEYAAQAIVAIVPPEAVVVALLPVLLDICASSTAKWQSKVGALKILGSLNKKAPEDIGRCLVQIIPPLTSRMHDTKPQVSKAAVAAALNIVKVVQNLDIIPFLPKLVDCMLHPDNVPTCIKALSGTTFVAQVDAPTLALMVPLLSRALLERNTLTLRSTVIVIDNLCKLVVNPAEAAEFLPVLLPGVAGIAQNAAMPEVRVLAQKAKDTLIKAGAAADKASDTADTPLKGSEIVQVLGSSILTSDTERLRMSDPVIVKVLSYYANMLAPMVERRAFIEPFWCDIGAQYLQCVASNPKASAKALLDHYLAIDSAKYAPPVSDEDPSTLLVNVHFSLAYGGLMLLNHTYLTLHKRRRYGVVAHNGAGKSTLMRSIAEGKVEGFPSREEVKTCFVEHKMQGAENEIAVLDFIAQDEELQKMGVPRAEISKVLGSVGFTDERQAAMVSSLSGGWKMKLELARAMLEKADILLLDEPTNHLDVANVQWLVDYLTKGDGQKVTCLIVSHDSGFLDNVCTDIIHYEQKKLAYYKGNLSKFVEIHPEAKSYYTLAVSSQKFSFPAPSILAGIRSNTRAILRMNNAHFTYPGAAKKSLENVSVSVSLSSRVAVLGPNGAGKSTLIKVLTGEVIPQEGKVDKHPNLRVAYVAQHALHHVEQHLDLTPVQYLTWRYAQGEDREVLAKQTRAFTDQDIAQLNKPIKINDQPRYIESIVGRSKQKKSFQYEIKWKGLQHKFNTHFAREQLLEHGFSKIVQQFDDFEASREGLGYRDLRPPVIKKHFEDIGLPGDIAMYHEIKGLSGGQKVKVVIAAAMWNNPHILIMDEPTNYLDRDAMGGLAHAMRDFGGGVVLISHNEEFLNFFPELEVWHVDAGKLTHSGSAPPANSTPQGGSAIASGNVSDSGTGTATPITTAPGTGTNTPGGDAGGTGEFKAKKKKKKTRADMKAQEVRRRLRKLEWLQSGGPRPEDTDSD